MAGDMDAVLSDYAEDATFIRQGGQVADGHAGIRAVFDEIGKDLDGFSFEQVSITGKDSVLLLEWHGRHDDGRIANGSDTFVMQDGKIHHQTLAFWIS
jgi:ketosteroid isomerase-like protein